MKRFTMTVEDAMFQKLENERKEKGQISIQETIREIIADYFRP